MTPVVAHIAVQPSAGQGQAPLPAPAATDEGDPFAALLAAVGGASPDGTMSGGLGEGGEDAAGGDQRSNGVRRETPMPGDAVPAGPLLTLVEMAGSENAPQADTAVSLHAGGSVDDGGGADDAAPALAVPDRPDAPAPAPAGPNRVAPDGSTPAPATAQSAPSTPADAAAGAGTAPPRTLAAPAAPPEPTAAPPSPTPPGNLQASIEGTHTSAASAAPVAGDAAAETARGEAPRAGAAAAATVVADPGAASRTRGPQAAPAPAANVANPAANAAVGASATQTHSREAVADGTTPRPETAPASGDRPPPQAPLPASDLGLQSADRARLDAPAAQTLEPLGPTLATRAPQATANLATPAPAQASASAPSVSLAAVAVRIAQHAQSGAKRFDIRLDPPDLGRVEVRLDVSRSGQVVTHLVVERAETLDMLQRDARALERALQDAGLDTSQGGLTFTLKDRGQADRGPDGGGDADDAEDRPPADETALEAWQPVSTRGPGGAGLDIRI